ncbi:TRAP transporter large permease [Rhodospirillaceae bacterium KN72]|uniref:TRAP transporter large permease protein n=1 Tax=Pacificispira spongiicola TaxID=2729598 RepID=A0A7Y0E2X5_9PROT|nr:TRAP transporter large permease [Pacificispira spongiicola]NMM46211.1 TRAP transporter large permease [Pacificispira spongiicola]
MSTVAIGFLGLAVLLVLLAIRIPVAFAMFAVGLGGLMILNGPAQALSVLSSETFSLASNAELVVIPLFILMGNIATESRMSRALYDAAYAWIGSIRGGLASATVVGCAGFAALSGSSVASALTMGRVSLSEMDRFNYAPRLSTGAVAAGGTLGILIPPSTGFVLYAILTRESIGRLFLAGVLPGLMLTVLFVIAISILTTVKPSLGPKGPKTTWRRKAESIVGALPILSIIVLTIGGIYFGLFSPVEAAAVGAGLAILGGVIGRTLTLKGFLTAVKDSIATTATVMLILIAAHVIGPFLALSHLPTFVGEALTNLDIGRYGILALILCAYLVLGCFLEGFAMLVLTMPIFFPVITALGFDPVWFGVVVVLTLEMGLITPPVGVNVFIVKSVAPNVPIGEIFRGVAPFMLAMVVAVLILTLFPSIALFLPNTMIGS